MPERSGLHFAPAESTRWDDQPVECGEGDVIVWWVALDGDEAEPGDAEALDPLERVRAERFVRAVDRRRWIRTRVALRAIIGRQLRVSAREVAFTTGPLGKPALAAPHAGLAFNVAHSRDCALVAVARNAAVGVDVECAATHEVEGSWLEVARGAFPPREVARLAGLASPAERAAAFRRAWCCREAWLKAHGVGLTVPLDGLEVLDHGPAGGCTLVDDDRRVEPGDWTAWLLAPRSGADCQGAVVVAGRSPRLVLSHWLPG